MKGRAALGRCPTFPRCGRRSPRLRRVSEFTKRGREWLGSVHRPNHGSHQQLACVLGGRRDRDSLAGVDALRSTGGIRPGYMPSPNPVSGV